jgi:hypothetical protein
MKKSQLGRLVSDHLKLALFAQIIQVCDDEIEIKKDGIKMTVKCVNDTVFLVINERMS